ncbi:sigma-70 family RNA polymerase sigma factor [Aggregatimonas sangjinii]|uniref:Sigma-70 family RNA polymerase sigma factor n=1 Tax=Aggregatimonas sangjinii TaxID=2583587 RepID=A0A5B7SNI3_9FLAO|nr:sigma-70 family RNA polymerase sigma factor [Aggregatimonas sangjinii]QCW98582.1 sigma-70 family RNA polymerase sigma factor [Aggregatimonas sangjinii]
MEKEIERIWIDLHDELFRFVQGRVKNEQTAKDILQEVFLKIQLNLPSLKHTAKLTSWVYQITRNTITDTYRKSGKTTSIAPFDFPEEEGTDSEYAKLEGCINRKIKELSPKHEEAILLTAFKKYSQKDLATHLNISYSGTKSRVQKAKELLKEAILDCPSVASDSTGKLLGYDKKEG